MTNITDDYDDISSSIYTDYDNLSIANCTNKEHDFGINIPALLFTIPFGRSF